MNRREAEKQQERRSPAERRRGLGAASERPSSRDALDLLERLAALVDEEPSGVVRPSALDRPGEAPPAHAGSRGGESCDAHGEAAPRASEEDTSSLPSRALELFRGFCGARRGSIYLADGRGGLHLSGRRESPEIPEHIPLPAAAAEPATAGGKGGGPVQPESPTSEDARVAGDAPLMDRAVRRREALFVSDVDRFRARRGLPPRSARSGTSDSVPEGLLPEEGMRDPGGSCVVLPLIHGERLVGVLNLSALQSTLPRTGGATRRTLMLAARWLASIIDSRDSIAELRSRASRDGLTGLYNHAAFYELLEREIQRGRRYGAPLALIILDLDGLKGINDEFGHLTGDAVLYELARRLREAVRGPDLAARYAGDEFAVLLPQSDLRGAERVAARIRERIAAQPFAGAGKPIAISTSAGIAQLESDLDARELVRRADAALYRAKRAGRNCVRAHGDDGRERAADPAAGDAADTEAAHGSHKD